MRRRTLLKGLGVGAALATAGAIGTLIYLKADEAAEKKRAVARAREAEVELLRGNIRGAKTMATEARALDRMNHEAWLAFIHASAVDLIDGDAGKEEGVALVADARNSGGRGATLELVALAGAVAIKNDNFAEKLVKQPHAEPVDGDGLYAYAAGAVLDLVCDDASVGWYEQALELRPGCVLSRVRLARANVLTGAFALAREAIEGLPPGFERLVLETLVTRVESIAASPTGAVARGKQVERAKLGDLPKSLRTLGAALALEDPDQPWGQSAGIDAALDDADTPMVCILAGRIALADGDRVSARAAAAAALAMHEELADARVFGARVALVVGDHARASELTENGPDRNLVAIVRSLEAYEANDRAAFDKVRADDPDAVKSWLLADSAATLLDGKSPDAARLEALAKRCEPWAELFAIDAALIRGDKEKAAKIAQQWTGSLSAAQKKRKDRVAGVSPLPPPAPSPPPSTSASAGPSGAPSASPPAAPSASPPGAPSAWPSAAPKPSAAPR
ncbi:MAG: hypothetical protein U0414_08430 [Polyangiaceae bacterium]